jgi:GT2 family glycosyltransferase
LEDERLKQLESEIARMRDEHMRMQQALDAMRGLLLGRREEAGLRKLTARLDRVEHTVNDTAVLLKEMLNSRIWKTLQAAGGLVLTTQKIKLWKHRPPALLTEEEKREHIQMRCDTLPPKAERPVSGKVRIDGWCASPDGVEKVEVQVGSEGPIEVRYGAERPDIQACFPKFRDALHSGFTAVFDTETVVDGTYEVVIRATSRNGKTRELRLPLSVNQHFDDIREYRRWIETFEKRDADLIHMQLTGFRYRPLVSVLTPVYKTGLEILKQTIASVKNQSYPNWELCIVDDGSGIQELTALLEREAATDPRIRVSTRVKQGGISAASNDALRMARGEYIALLDHDDMLAQDALFYMVSELQDSERPDLLYSDEDHIDEEGNRFSAFFKPDWSPDLILGENYVCHLMVFRKELAETAGGFSSEFDLSQDHDILLRMSEKARRIVHVPRMLYHWRTRIQSMKRASTSEDKALASSFAVVRGFLKDRGRVEEGLYPGRWRVRYPVPPGTRVSILIPTAGKMDILERNLNALWKTAGYEDYEVVIIDNSKAEKIEQYTDHLRKAGRPVRRFDQRGEPFNYSRLNNLAAATCTTELLLFLNDDTEGISDGWLLAMVELAMRPEVGAVGAKLLYPNGKIQHAGVTMGLAEICGHSFKGLNGADRHYFDFPDLIRNVSALTAACVMVRTKVFEEVGGFDEQMFPIAYNDIDLTLKIGAAGYRLLYTPFAQLYHYEAFSKSDAELHPHPNETKALKTKWKDVIARDPFYNPNLTRHIENWSFKWD